MFVNLGSAGLSSDIDVNVSSLLEKLKIKAELEAKLAETQASIDLFADRSYQTLKGKVKTKERSYSLDLIVLDREGNAYNLRLEEYYKDDDRDGDEPSIKASLEIHESL